MCTFHSRVGQGSTKGITKARGERIPLDTEEKMGQHVGIKPYCDGRNVITPLREDVNICQITEDKRETNSHLVNPINVSKGVLGTYSTLIKNLLKHTSQFLALAGTVW